MGKRKTTEDGEPKKATRADSDLNESSSEDDTDLLDVDFEWFDPQPEYDFHGLKILVRQLFDVDAQCIDLSALTDLILAQPLLGSTVKVDGNKTDPLAFLSVLNLHEHRDKPCIQPLISYIRQQASRITALRHLDGLLNPDTPALVGLILTERVLNVPSEVVPPMYKMLLEEITWALEEKEPYQFTHYLIFSKTYQEIASSLDEEETQRSKKQKKEMKRIPLETFHFHPEDGIFERHSVAHGSFTYVKEVAESDSKRAFQETGIKPQGHMILVDAIQFNDAVEALQKHPS